MRICNTVIVLDTVLTRRVPFVYLTMICNDIFESENIPILLLNFLEILHLDNVVIAVTDNFLKRPQTFNCGIENFSVRTTVSYKYQKITRSVYLLAYIANYIQR